MSAPATHGTPAAGELEFATSGSTGQPVRWIRTAAQVRAEAALLVELFRAEDADGIVCYPPPHHFYGYLMARAVPELLGVPVRRIGLTDSPVPALDGLRRPLVATLPAAFDPLARCRSALAELDELVIVHSSAVLPAAAGRLLASLDGRARLVELFGSTETGLVATRTHYDRPEWTLAADVAWGAGTRVGSTGALRVRSPRIAHQPGRAPADELELDDVVTVLDERTFRWQGRRSRLLKINGRRVNLDDVEAVLADAAPGVAVTCRAERDDLRGEWFSVFVDRADAGVLAALRAACRTLPSWQQPRAIHPRRPVPIAAVAGSAGSAGSVRVGTP